MAEKSGMGRSVRASRSVRSGGRVLPARFGTATRCDR